jgi:hypothetical protein
MSTATVDETTSSPRRSSNSRSRSDARSRSSEPALGLVVTDVASAVDFMFDLVEQVVSVSRRTAHEVAAVVEAAIEAAETRAAA